MYQIVTSDLFDWLNNYDGPRFHALLSDPPYGLAFMGKGWDKFKTNADYQAWVTEWAELLIEKALYPGAVCAFFGGARMFHRLACGLEDAGFEVFDTMMWMYGSGFPKSHDISKAIDKASGAEREVVGYAHDFAHDGYNRKDKQHQSRPTQQIPDGDRWELPVTAPATPGAIRWDGYGTALKPAWEPIILCRAPRGKHRFIDLALKFGTGALWIDGCRIGVGVETWPARRSYAPGQLQPGGSGNTELTGPMPAGRWPTNVILDEGAADMLDGQSGESSSQRSKRGNLVDNRGDNYGRADGRCINDSDSLRGYNDSGGASRFYYTAKSSRREREAGLSALPPKQKYAQDGRWGAHEIFSGATGDDEWRAKHPMKKARNSHPCVKPIAITEYIARLMRPPELAEPRRLLVPFAGSGSEVVGGMRAGWDEVVGIEIDDDYATIAKARLEYWSHHGVQERLL